MSISIDQFIRQIVDSSLMSAEDVRAVVSLSSADQQPADAQQLARELVRRKKLTAFQAQEIYKGRGKNLVLGNYIVLEKLGQGGMGMVLKAEHKRMERMVAIKVLSPMVTKSRETAARFQREVKAAAKLTHAHIVRAYDADEANGTHFLVMEYVEGTDLAALVKKRGRQSIEKALHYVLHAARGLEYAHSRGVVHRDIKPANLLLDREGVVKILDMGLARLDSEGSKQDQMTGTGQIMGTVDYMAPEQAADTHQADARADIYALGVTLWYLLTARELFEGDTIVKKLMAHQQRPIPSLCHACPEATPSLEAVFTKMVAKTPEARYQTMTELIAELERCQADGTSNFAVRSTNVAGSSENSRISLGEVEDDNGILKTSNVATAAKKTIAPSPDMEATLGFQSSQVDTDPETNKSLLNPLLALNAKRPPPRTPWWHAWNKWIAGGSGGLILLAAIVYFVQTKDGMIRVEIDDPQIEVSIKGTDIVLKQADEEKDVKLSAGDHTLVVQRGDFTFETNKLIIKKGEKVTVNVELLADQVAVKQGDKVIGQRKLPSEPIIVGESPDSPTDAQPLDPNDPHWIAAEQILRSGGHGVLQLEDGSTIKFTKVSDLPRKNFTISRIFFINSKTPDDAGFEGLTNIHTVRELMLWGSKISDVSLSKLNCFKNAETIQLGNNHNYDGSGLAQLKPMPNVKSLSFTYSKFSDAVMVYLDRFPNIESLSLDGTKISDKELASLASFQSLRRLKIGRNPVTDTWIKMLAGIQKLQELFLDETAITDQALEELAQCKTLQILDVRKTKVTAEGVSRFEKVLPTCKVISDFSAPNEGEAPDSPKEAQPLDPNDPHWIAAEQVLGGRGHITVRLEDGSLLSTDKLHDLSRQKFAIEVIYFNGGTIDDAGFERLKSLDTVKELGLWSTAISDVSLGKLNRFENVEKLEFGYNFNYDGSGLAKLKPMPTVKNLRFGFTHSKFSDAGMVCLDRFPNVEYLHLNATKITGKEISRLQTLKSLRHLNLNSNPATDAWVKELLGVQKLQELFLSETDITDQALELLAQCKSLQLLEVKKTKVTAEGVSRFAKTLPTCQIISDFSGP